MASSTIAEAPKPGTVYWTAFSPPEGDSRPSDPLRFDMYAQRLGNLMLPGITNRTERLRYLSMVCAGLRETGHPGRSLRDRRRDFLPFERGWALAQTLSADGELKERVGEGRQPSLKPEFRGLRGANRVLSHYRTLGLDPMVHPSDYVLLKSQDAQGGLGAYLVSLRQFGFVHDGSLELTAPGDELADAFRPRTRGRNLSTLAAPEAVRRNALARIGEDLCLGRPSPSEQEIVRRAVFEDERQTAAVCVRRMREALPGSNDPEALLTAIADPGGDQIGGSAHFAILFDPMRLALLRVFARLGRGVLGQPGPVRLAVAAGPGLEAAAAEAREAAAALASCATPSGLEPIHDLAADVAAGASLGDTVSSTLRFHQREGRAWILEEGSERYSIGKHGPFEDPRQEFNGYTVGPAIGLCADTEVAA